VKYVLWLLALPVRLFETIAGKLVEALVDQAMSRQELRTQRDALMEELEKPQAGGMGGQRLAYRWRNRREAVAPADSIASRALAHVTRIAAETV
jgi:hypothetical protein